MDSSNAITSKMKWYFPDDTSILDTGINSLKFDTPDDDIKMFVRELCQNSCDASTGGKVTVDFELFRIPADDFPDRNGFIMELDGCRKMVESYGGDPSALGLYTEMISAVKKQEITVMRASDFGTTGACGSNETHGNHTTPWKSMTISRGISNKTGNSGGSFGRGKDSFFAVSQLHTVFFYPNRNVRPANRSTT